MRNSTNPSKSEVCIEEALNRYQIVGTPAEASFDRLVELTAQIFNLPICQISFIDQNEVYFKASIGLEDKPSVFDSQSMCNQLMNGNNVTVIEDVSSLPDLANKAQHIRFYAGLPLLSENGDQIGTFCIMGYEPLKFDEKKQEVLAGLAKLAVDQAALRLQANHLICENENMAADHAGLVDYQQEMAKANRDLENLRENFELLFEQAPMAIGIISGDRYIIEQANHTLLKTLGGDDALIGKPLSVAVPDLEGQDVLKLIEKVSETGEPQQGNEVKLLVWKENQLKSHYINITLQPTRNPENHSSSIMFILADITEQVIAKQLNQEANIVLMSAIEAGEMGYTVVEFATGKMVSNDQFKRNYGYGVNDEFDYSDLFEAMLPKYRHQIKMAVKNAIDHNGVYQAEYEVKWQDGSVHWIRAFGKPRYDMHGRASHIIGLNKIIKNK